MAGWIAGKRVLITGATRGIGLAAAKELAGRGALVTIVARDPARGETARREVGHDADVIEADLATLRGVRELAAEFDRRHQTLEGLVNNAGAMNARRTITGDGLELTWAVNHLAPFLLTELLLPKLKASAPARIVTTASDAHRGASIPFDDLTAERGMGPFGLGRYGQTKLANILFTRELARRLEGTAVSAYCYHPGNVATGFNRNNGPLMRFGMDLIKPFSRSPEKGAETLVWLLDESTTPEPVGGYFHDRRPATPTKEARDDATARRLWELSEEQTRG
jgi:NAD(P)-dependent dehydrogenase (short-subunit alcohol dehydrogenase family)